MMSERSVRVIADPAWPWSLPGFGWLLLAAVAVLLVGLTVWTYRGLTAPRRVTMITLLRLAALAVALLTALRPALAILDEQKPPGVLLVLSDASASMTIRDELANRSRWEEIRRAITACEPAFAKLQETHNVTVHRHTFGERLDDDNPEAEPTARRSDYGQALDALYARYGVEPNLRGVILCGDGADNGTRFPTLAEAAKWRGRGCPLHTVALGQPTTSSSSRDLSVAALNLEPSVPIKTPLNIRFTLDAPGYAGGRVRPRLLLDDEEAALYRDRKLTIPLDAIELSKERGNEENVYVLAPAKAGEVKVTLKVEPLPGEVSTSNNEVSTFVTVTKEGVSILLVDRLREELKFVREALAQDPRLRVDEVNLQTEDGAADLLQLERQAYDVIILGDVSAKTLASGRPTLLDDLAKLVKDKGCGLMMIGGHDSFGGDPATPGSGDWVGTPIADLLPVQLEPGQVDEAVRIFMRPTPEGLRHFIMRLAPEKENAAIWEKMPYLRGMSKLGRTKPGAAVLAINQTDATPVLVGQQVGQGRVLAMAADTTFRWRNLGLPKSLEGVGLHAKFWRQVVLWLAKQEETDGALQIRPDLRRMAVGGKLGFGVTLKGKTGVEIPKARFEAKVVGPDGSEQPVPLSQAGDQVRGSFWKADKPGEYRIVATGRGDDVDGTPVSGESTARFLAYQDDTELLRQAADHEFLAKLASAGGGKAIRADDLPRFLQEMESAPPAAALTKLKLYPDWRSASLSPLIPLVLILFTGLVGTEWALRRKWGLA